MDQKLRFNHTDEELKQMIEEVFYEYTIKPEREIVLFAFSDEGMKLFHQAVKDEVKRLYGNNE